MPGKPILIIAMALTVTIAALLVATLVKEAVEAIIHWIESGDGGHGAR